MGLDWRHLSLGGYLEAMEAHNEAHDPKAPREPGEPTADLGRLRRFRRAHRDGGNPEGSGSVASGPSSGAS